MPTKPFESKIQDLVYNVDVGIGLRLIKFGLYILFLLLVMVFYTASEFRGLREAEAMDFAQIGRNLMFSHQFQTKCVRPASMWYLIENVSSPDPRIDHNPRVMEHPDIVHPPLYSVALAAGFKALRSAFVTIDAAKVWQPEQWIIMPMGHLFTMITGVLVFLLARRLFDGRVALLAVTLFFLSDNVWRMSISGLPIPLAAMFTTAAMYFAVAGAARRDEGRAPFTWAVLLLGSAVCCGLAFLTRYGTAVLAPALVLYVGFSCRERGWRWGTLYLLVFLAVIAPWIARNILVSGGPLGLAPYVALNGEDPVLDNTFERMLAPTIEFGTMLHTIRLKAQANVSALYNEHLRTLGEGLLGGLFLATFFYSFAREHARRFRWCALPALLGLVALAAVFGRPTAQLLHIFVPVATIYGTAFFFILFDRLQLRLPIQRFLVSGAFIVLTALPLVLTLLPPGASRPYPPYQPYYVAHVTGLLNDDEMICTDMPWATAWYGDRSSLLLPDSIDNFYEINDYTKRVSGLYFTTLTRDREYVKTLLTGNLRSWFPLQTGQIPGDFPLQQGFPLNNLDQIFLTDRARWQEK